MFDEIVQKIARLMREQAKDYRTLDATTTQLVAALVRGAPAGIESFTHTGEDQLLKMRSRLLQIMSALSEFSEARMRTEDPQPLASEIRNEFEAASDELMYAARSFESTSNRAACLAVGGTTFASFCIQMCGITPSTYSVPYSKHAEA